MKPILGLPSAAGVYMICNAVSGKLYVGSATNIRTRINGHINKLRDGHHNNEHLQSAFRRYGESAFVFSVIELCEISERVSREQFHIDRLRTCDRSTGYNKAPRADGKSHSTQTRERISRSLMGHRFTAETRAKMSLSRRGRKGHPMSQATKEKLALARARKPKPPEKPARKVRERKMAEAFDAETARERRRAAARERERRKREAGIVVSAETRAKMSASQRGKKKPRSAVEKTRLAKIGKPRSEETKAKLRAAMLGRTLPPDVRDKIAAANRGKKRSAQAIANIGVAGKAAARAKRIALALDQGVL